MSGLPERPASRIAFVLPSLILKFAVLSSADDSRLLGKLRPLNSIVRRIWCLQEKLTGECPSNGIRQVLRNRVNFLKRSA